MTHPASLFLMLLDPSPDATFNIETFTDLPKGATKPKPDPLCGRHANLSREDVAALIPHLREQNERGAAVYVAVNQCKGQRSKRSVVRVRGVHADLDGVPPATLAAIRSLLEPTIIVQSSRDGHYHVYWLLKSDETMSAKTAEAINRGLVAHGADPAAIDVSRLLRLPGFHHTKGQAGDTSTDTDQLSSFDHCPITAVIATGAYHSAAEIKAKLCKAPPRASVMVPNAAKIAVNQEHISIIDGAAAHMELVYPKLWSGDYQSIKDSGKQPKYPSQSEADMALASYIARHLAGAGVPAELMATLADATFSRSALAERVKWQDRADYRASTISRACASALMLNSSTLVMTTATVDWSLHGDIRTSEFFAAMWTGELAFVPEFNRWMRWRGSRWTWCTSGEEIECAKATGMAILSAAAQILTTDPARGQKLVREAAQVHLATRLKAMVDLARSAPLLSSPASQLDAEPSLLGVGNGVVDLSQGRLQPNRPGLYVTRYCRANFNPEAVCPRWLTFLDEVFQGDTTTINAVQRLLGYTLTGLSREEIIIFCIGFGANGKSIFGNVVAQILGDYSKVAPSSLLAPRRSDDHGPRADLAMLDGTRMASINELPAGMHLNEQIVKLLAGREPIAARQLYGQFFSFQPQFTPWLRSNHKPIVRGDDDGIWRRLVILPFRRSFSREEQDPHLEAKLMVERDGILSWMVEGARQYLRDGLKLSPTMMAEQTSYRRDSDVLGEFLAERTVSDPTARQDQQHLYNNWTIWCQQNGLQPGSKKSFTQRLAERGYGTSRSNGKAYYTGVQLVAACVEPVRTVQEGQDVRNLRKLSNLNFS